MKVSRLEKGGGMAVLPPVPDGGDYLIEAWRALGLKTLYEGGFGPILWSELNAYNQMNGGGLDGWDGATIIAMSTAYTTTLGAATAPLYIPPIER